MSDHKEEPTVSFRDTIKMLIQERKTHPIDGAHSTEPSDDLSCGPGTIIHGMPDWVPTEPAAQQSEKSVQAPTGGQPQESAVAAAPFKYRADAVNLASNYDASVCVTNKGMQTLCQAVLEMDAYIKSLPIQAHSKTEYKRMVEQGANVLPPGGADTPETDALVAKFEACDYLFVNHARKLERERDAARAENANLAKAIEAIRLLQKFTYQEFQKADAELAAANKQLERYASIQCEAGTTLGDTLDEWERAEELQEQLAAASKRAEDAESDAAIGRLVKAKMVSGNSVPVPECRITRKEIDEVKNG
tara:strand:- start:27 stop:941 length:915 start_codon:yes stop_codon:yes gene_type:complete